MKMNRRQFLSDSLATAFLGAVGGCATVGDAVGCVYPGWKPGELDIHFIHTGTSENTFMIFPDGTTMLLDCGHVKKRRPGYAEALPPMPSGERRAGEWVGRYIKRLIPQREIDYLMVSHWHSDHMAGIPDVAESFRFLNYYDHQYPNVGKYRRDVDDADFDVFQKWLEPTLTAGMRREPFKVGAKDQIRLRHDPTDYYKRVFEIRNLAANGVMWDGKKNLIDVAGEHVKQTGVKYIAENALSSAIRIRYGGFTYFTGGDLEGEFVGGDGKKFSYEERVGEVVGPVCVCKTNHHAFFPSMRDAFVKSTKPQLFLSSAWSPNQQNPLSLGRMTAAENYAVDSGKPIRPVVAYGAIPEFRKRQFDQLGLSGFLALEGHAVVKVNPGGFAFKLYTLTAQDESMRIVGVRDFLCC